MFYRKKEDILLNMLIISLTLTVKLDEKIDICTVHTVWSLAEHEDWKRGKTLSGVPCKTQIDAFTISFLHTLNTLTTTGNWLALGL